MRKLLCLVKILIMSIIACGSENVKNAETGAEKNNNTNENVQKSDNNGNRKVLVAYFSRTGNTEQVANMIAEVLNANVFKIEAVTPYTDADINYNNNSSRANKEQNNLNARPEIKGKVENFEQYDIIFLGYPIWWGTSPKIMSTFVESYDFKGKTVIPFVTSGSSPISSKDLENLIKNANWKQGKRFPASVSKSQIEIWIKELDLH